MVLAVEEMQPILVSAMGEVSRPGAYPIGPESSLAEVLAVAGGLTDYASRDSIYVVRTKPRPERIRFTYLAISRNEGNAGTFRMHAGDVVVAE